MDQDQKATVESTKIDNWMKIADLFGKYIAIFATIIGGFVGYQQYLESKASELEVRRREFRLGFFKQEMDTYVQACRTVGALASADDPKDESVKKDIDRFYSLYWGDLSVFEDSKIESKMVEFEQLLRRWQQHGGFATTEMQRASYELAHLCRHSLESTFDLDLQELPPRTVPPIRVK